MRLVLLVVGLALLPSLAMATDRQQCFNVGNGTVTCYGDKSDAIIMDNGDGNSTSFVYPEERQDREDFLPDHRTYDPPPAADSRLGSGDDDFDHAVEGDTDEDK